LLVKLIPHFGGEKMKHHRDCHCEYCKPNWKKPSVIESTVVVTPRTRYSFQSIAYLGGVWYVVVDYRNNDKEDYLGHELFISLAAWNEMVKIEAARVRKMKNEE